MGHVVTHASPDKGTQHVRGDVLGVPLMVDLLTLDESGRSRVAKAQPAGSKLRRRSPPVAQRELEGVLKHWEEASFPQLR